jgi:hypothetical protein
MILSCCHVFARPKLAKCGTFRIGDRDFVPSLRGTRSIHCGTEMKMSDWRDHGTGRCFPVMLRDQPPLSGPGGMLV